jgi:hypothetical protein
VLNSVSVMFQILPNMGLVSSSFNIVTRRGDLEDRFLDWMIGFIAPYAIIEFGTTGNTALITVLHNFSLQLHTH